MIAILCKPSWNIYFSREHAPNMNLSKAPSTFAPPLWNLSVAARSLRYNCSHPLQIILKLPFETLGMISSWSSTAQPADVITQSLTCHAWKQPATEVLYRTVDLQTLRESCLFLQTIQSAAHLHRLVRAIHHCPASLVERCRFSKLFCDILKLLWNLNIIVLLAPPTTLFGWNVDYVWTWIEFIPQSVTILYFVVSSIHLDDSHATD